MQQIIHSYIDYTATGQVKWKSDQYKNKEINQKIIVEFKKSEK